MIPNHFEGRSGKLACTVRRLFKWWVMKRLLIPLMFLPFSVLADVPDFQCWDIHNDSFSTDGGVYATRYINKMPIPDGSYIYETAPNMRFYQQVIINNIRFDDGYYYGARYQDKEGKIYNDIKCKRK